MTPCLRPRFALPLAVLGAACHEDRSSDSTPVPSTSTINLSLTFENALGSGGLRFLEVSELRQGLDLDGDGDLFDRIAVIVDLDQRRLVDTRLSPGFPRSAESPQPVVTVSDEAIAFAVSEAETGGLDRNGDGDALDRVLALYERDTGIVTNLGVAARFVVANAEVAAFDVPESQEGRDLDGDGDQDDDVPFVHDRRTGETWSTGLAGARVLGVDGGSVALAVDEAVLGDRNGDGDALDSVLHLVLPP